MQYLSQFPEVVTGDAYPYELKLANYYSAARSLSTHATEGFDIRGR